MCLDGVLKYFLEGVRSKITRIYHKCMNNNLLTLKLLGIKYEIQQIYVISGGKIRVNLYIVKMCLQLR